MELRTQIIARSFLCPSSHICINKVVYIRCDFRGTSAIVLFYYVRICDWDLGSHAFEISLLELGHPLIHGTRTPCYLITLPPVSSRITA